MSNLFQKVSSPNKHILNARLVDRKLVTKSDERTFLITLEFEEPVLFSAGDSIAIYPHNSQCDVLEWCKILNIEPDYILSESLTVFEYLKTSVALNKWTSKMSQVLFPEGKLPLDMKDLDPIVILKSLTFSTDSSLKLLECLAPQMPRYYSIASSPVVSNCRMDLLVALNSFEINGVKKFGLASSYLCKDIDLGSPIRGFIHSANHFRIADTNVPMIMIGPGTGVAPFRAFIQERVRLHAKKNWLFFGERNRCADFYFEDELSDLESSGHLKLSLAFSRDQDYKIYVQHLISQHKAEIIAWLKEGAYIFVCGDAKNMAKDVEQALIEIIQEYQGLDVKEATVLLREWKKSGRYNLDVY